MKTETIEQRFARCCIEVAEDIEAGVRFGGGRTFNYDGSPCCAVGQVTARFGVGHVDYGVFHVFGVSTHLLTYYNDSGRWDECAKELRWIAAEVLR